MPDDRYTWLTVRDASRRLGRSPETIRRQAKDGTLEHPWEWAPRSRNDKRLAIFIGFPKVGATPHEPSATPHDATVAPDALRLLSDAHQAEVAALKAQHASERHSDASRIARLEGEVNALDETAQLLAAELIEALRRVEEEREAARLQASAERRPWWWRWWRGE